MPVTDLRRLILPIVLACASCQAAASVELRVESRPISQPIDAYVLVTEGRTPVAGLTAADFSITLDGLPLDDFELSPPPGQDPTQQVSVVVVMKAGSASHYLGILDELEVGDYVAIVKYWSEPERIRNGGLSVLPFTQIDDDKGSQALSDFMRGGTPQFSNERSRFLFDGLLAGVGQLWGPPNSLPDGPKAIVTLVDPRSIGFSRVSLSQIIASANASSVPIFISDEPYLSTNRTVVGSSSSLAANTGGVRIPVASKAVAKSVSWLEHGYRITIPPDAVPDCEWHMLEVTIHDEIIGAPFVRCDTTPERFEFAAPRPVAVGSEVVSEPVFITDIETAAPVSVLDGEYSIGCGTTFTSADGWIRPGQSICVRHTAATSDGLKVITVLTIDGLSAAFVSKATSSVPPPPPPGGGGPISIVEALLLLGLLSARSSGKKGLHRPDLRHSDIKPISRFRQDYLASQAT